MKLSDSTDVEMKHTSNETVMETAKQVMEDNKGLMQKLAAHEAAELIDDAGIEQPQLAQEALQAAATPKAAATPLPKKTRPSPNDKFSKTIIKKLLQMNKNQLINMIIQMSNYSEQQKTANIILGNAMNELKTKKAAELESAAAQTSTETEETK